MTGGRLDDVRWIDMPSHRDDRGTLTVIEGCRDIPFDIRRVYFVHDVVRDRGGHAHRLTHQVVVALSGSFDLTLADGASSRTFHLNAPTRGVLFGPMLFITMDNFSDDARSVTLASTHYDPSQSIRSWDEYLRAIAPETDS